MAADEPPAEGVPEPDPGLALPGEVAPKFAAAPSELFPRAAEFPDIAVELPDGDPAGPPAEFPAEGGPGIAAKSDKAALDTEFRFLEPPPRPQATEFEMSWPDTAGGTTCE